MTQISNIKGIRFASLIVVFLGASMILHGCSTVQLSPMQKRSITTRIIEGGYESVFRSVMTVLQDHDYIIEGSDIKTGLINASVRREKDGFAKFMQSFASAYNAAQYGTTTKYTEGTSVSLNAIVEKINDLSSEVRINIEQKEYYASGGHVNAKQIYDVEIYEALFNDIRIEAKRREALNRN